MKPVKRDSLKKISFLSLAVLFCVLAATPVAAGIVTADTSEKVSVYFEEAKQNEALLVAFLHKMPKGADLHNHPSGAAGTEGLIDEAIDKGLVFDRVERSFVKSTINPQYTSNDMMYDFWKTDEVLDALSMRNQAKERENGHTHFFIAFYRFGEAMPGVEKIITELVNRAASQRVSYLELMSNVVSMPEGLVDYDQLRQQLMELDGFRKNALASLEKKGEAWNVDIAWTLTLNRGGVSDALREAFDERAYEDYFRKRVKDAMNLAVNLRDDGVRGITILSAEDSWFSRNYFGLQMRVIDEEWRSLSEEERENLKLNLHAGELAMEYSPYEVMRDRISTTIKTGHASRIGHGTDIMWEDDAYGLLREMRERRIAVEIIPSSSEGILGVAGGQRHPFRLYWDAGVPIAIATDDEGISRSNITLEYAKTATWFDLKYGEIKWLAFSSLEYSFLPGESLFVNGDFNKRKAVTDILLKSPKALKEIELCNAFLEFENRMEENIKQLSGR
jgi:hypothetical protein